MKKLVFLLLYLYAFWPLPDLAKEYRVMDEITAYNQGDYRQAIGIGQLLAVQNPANALVHYFLANAYTYLAQLAEAKQEYTLCEKLTNNLQMRGYCEEALSYLHKNEDAKLAVVQQTVAPFLGNEIITDRNSHLIIGARNSILQELDGMNNRATQDAQRLTEDIKKQAHRDIITVPRYIWLSSYQREPNPEFQYAVEKINRDTDNKIAIIQDGLSEKQRLRALSQLKSGSKPVLTSAQQAEAHDLIDWLRKDAEQRANNQAWLKRQDQALAYLEQDQTISLKNQRNALHNMMEDNLAVQSQLRWNQNMALSQLHLMQNQSGAVSWGRPPQDGLANSLGAGFNGNGIGGFAGGYGGFNGGGYGGNYGRRWGY